MYSLCLWDPIEPHTRRSLTFGASRSHLRLVIALVSAFLTRIIEVRTDISHNSCQRDTEVLLMVKRVQWTGLGGSCTKISSP